MQKGEVWWAEFPPPTGRRPVVLLSRSRAYETRTEVTVAKVTRTIRSIPVEVALGIEDGMPEKCVANMDTITTVSKARLSRKITELSLTKIAQINAAVKFALDID